MIKNIINILGEYQQTLFAKIILGLFNGFIVLTLYNYINYFIMFFDYNESSLAFVTNIIFILFPLLSIIWLRSNSLIRQIFLPSKNFIDKRKFFFDIAILISLIYLIAKYYTYVDSILLTGYNIFEKILFLIKPIIKNDFLLGELYFCCNENTAIILSQCLAYLVDILIIGLIFFSIYFCNIPSTIKCKNCGKRILKTQKFCNKCGEQL